MYCFDATNSTYIVFVDVNSTCFALLMLIQHALLCCYQLNMYCLVDVNSTCIALLMLIQHALFVDVNSTCIALLMLIQHVLPC